VETSNIGTLNALVDSPEQPFEQRAAKSKFEPKITDAAGFLNDC